MLLRLISCRFIINVIIITKIYAFIPVFLGISDAFDGPRNVAVVNGSTATFSCIINASASTVCWNRETGSSKSNKSDSYAYLYQTGEPGSYCNESKCGVVHDNATDHYTLTINSVHHHDAGFYACRVCFSKPELSAQLIVLYPIDPDEG